MFQIKICGIRCADDAQAVIDAGADALGLNFYAPSPRSIDIARAIEIAETVDASNVAISSPFPIKKVGLFVNADAATIHQTAEKINLDIIQLHGDEPVELLAELEGLCLLRAIRWREDSLDATLDYLDQCDQKGIQLAGLLIDAHVPDQYGGSGKCLDWHALAATRHHWDKLPLILAGGLRAENVAEAIRIVQPEGVDTASGVEQSPGVQDRAALKAFIAAAREAF